jgi:hypothetical protein
MKIFSINPILLTIAVLTGSIYSCSQQEGIGGNSNIKGKILVNYYNDDYSMLLSDKPAPAKDEDVYIIYGNDSTIGDKTTTSYSGDFEFNYLWPGNYKLYYYTKDSTEVSSDKIEKIKEITLGKNETLTLESITINKSLKWDEGTSSIKGTIWVINYKNTSEYPNLKVKDITLAQDQDIYIQYGKHPFYDKRIATSSDGTFIFQNLIKGKYRIFYYSEDITGHTAMIVKESEIEIKENNQYVEIKDTIEKL